MSKKHNFTFSIEVDDELSIEQFTLLIASVNSKVKAIEGTHKFSGKRGDESIDVESFIKVTSYKHSNHDFVLKIDK